MEELSNELRLDGGRGRKRVVTKLVKIRTIIAVVNGNSPS